MRKTIPVTMFTGKEAARLSVLQKWVIENKATDGWSPVIRPAQVGWILKRRRAGGRVFFTIRRAHDGGPRRHVHDY